MVKSTQEALAVPRSEVRDILTEVLRKGAQDMLVTTIEAEVNDYIQEHAELRDETGRRMVVRNGYMPGREIQTPIGKIEVQKPRVNDKRVDEEGNRIRFTSKILPPYLRKTSAWRSCPRNQRGYAFCQ